MERYTVSNSKTKAVVVCTDQNDQRLVLTEPFNYAYIGVFTTALWIVGI